MSEDETPVVQSSDVATVCHVEGYKDDYKVEVQFDTPRETWAPTNDKMFRWFDLWFQSEDHEFGETGYGHWMPAFYLMLIALGHGDEAQEAYKKRGFAALNHFENVVDEHADELMEVLMLLKMNNKDELPRLQK